METQAAPTMVPSSERPDSLAPPHLLTRQDVLCLLDSQHSVWKGDREGWVTLQHRGIPWRVHYRRGELLDWTARASLMASLPLARAAVA